MNPTPKTASRLSPISFVNFIKLSVRGLVFLTGVVLYITSRTRPGLSFSPNGGSFSLFFAVVWVIYVGEMIFRSFPVRLESMGCMKQFRKNYRPAPGTVVPDGKAVSRSLRRVAAAWVLFNALFGLFYFLHWIDRGILLLLSLAYGVCDVVCVLFFCPFQAWFMKNRCCVVCHIYNWDFIMLCTPLVFLPGWFEWSMLFCSLILFLRWQITHRRHPERFYEETNGALRCANCRERLCTHKRHLQKFMREHGMEQLEQHVLQEIAELRKRRS